jgi:hypothetical protein
LRDLSRLSGIFTTGVLADLGPPPRAGLGDLSRLSGIFVAGVLDGPRSASARPRRICSEIRFGLAQASLLWWRWLVRALAAFGSEIRFGLAQASLLWWRWLVRALAPFCSEIRFGLAQSSLD